MYLTWPQPMPTEALVSSCLAGGGSDQDGEAGETRGRGGGEARGARRGSAAPAPATAPASRQKRGGAGR